MWATQERSFLLSIMNNMFDSLCWSHHFCQKILENSTIISYFIGLYACTWVFMWRSGEKMLWKLKMLSNWIENFHSSLRFHCYCCFEWIYENRSNESLEIFIIEKWTNLIIYITITLHSILSQTDQHFAYQKSINFQMFKFDKRSLSTVVPFGWAECWEFGLYLSHSILVGKLWLPDKFKFDSNKRYPRYANQEQVYFKASIWIRIKSENR